MIRFFWLCQVVYGEHLFWPVQQGILLEREKNSANSFFQICQNEHKSSIHFQFTLGTVEKLFGFLVQYCCFQVFHCLNGNFASRPVKIKINEEVLTWSQVLFKFRIIDFVEDFVEVNVC